MTARTTRLAAVGARVSAAWLTFTTLALAQATPPPFGEAQGSPPTEVAAPSSGVTLATGELAASPLPERAGPETALDRARKGVVLLERGGKVVGVGAVLSGDGRVLTALSSVGQGKTMDVRFADGSKTSAKLEHSDRAWDLALLVPEKSDWKPGLRASRRSPVRAGSKLSAYSVVGNKELAPTRVIVTGERTLVGAGNELLKDALAIETRFEARDVGTPVVDEDGDVVALVARACAPAAGRRCTPTQFGVPVGAIKAFLRVAPRTVSPADLVGIQGVADTIAGVKGVRVTSVTPNGLAAAVGIKGTKDRAKGDLIVAVDGTPVATPEALTKALNAGGSGRSVELLVFGQGRYWVLPVPLTSGRPPNAPPRVRRPAPVKRPLRVPRPRPSSILEERR